MPRMRTNGKKGPERGGGMIKPILFNTAMVQAILDGRKTMTRRVVKNPAKPPCRKGDILYVREAWHKYTKRVGKGENCHLAEFYGYKASVTNSEDANEPWHPSIHMPKKAARIWLKVTDVRMERLQDIDDEEAKKEGANWKNGRNIGWEEKMRRTPTERFAEIWNYTIRKTDLDCYGWDANPWVWVIEFERCEKPEEV